MLRKAMLVTICVIVIIFVAWAALVVKQKRDSQLEAATKAITFGRIFGEKITQKYCLMGLKMKYALCAEKNCELAAYAYISACMEAAGKDDFCASVPNIKETEDSVGWVSDQCSSKPFVQKSCQNYMRRFVIDCPEQIESRTISKKEMFIKNFKSSFESELESKPK